MSRRMAIEGTHNFRDVGGYPAGAGSTRYGQLYRSDALTGITPTGLADLLALRIGVVVDLRSRLELSQDTTRWVLPDARVVNVPIEGGSRSSILKGDHISLEQLYRDIIDQAGFDLTAAVAVIAESGSLPVLVNCTAGKDRTGLVIALALEAAGVDRSAVVADYTQSALNLDGDWLDQTLTSLVSNGVPISPRLFEVLGGSPDHVMGQILGWLDREHGSVVGFLTAHGLEEDSVQRLHDKLVV